MNGLFGWYELKLPIPFFMYECIRNKVTILYNYSKDIFFKSWNNYKNLVRVGCVEELVALKAFHSSLFQGIGLSSLQLFTTV